MEVVIALNLEMLVQALPRQKSALVLLVQVLLQDHPYKRVFE